MTLSRPRSRGLRRRRRRAAARPAAVLLALGLLAGACTREPADRRSPEQPVTLPPDAPRLILLVVVDQLPASELERHRALFTGGLARLLEESASFTDAHHRHAVTETAPGHATVATGRHPRGHGIIGNFWFDRESGEDVYCIDDPDHGLSPRNLLATTLGDWLREAVPGSRVFAAGGKDRAAVLLGGHEPDGAFWYDRESGRFTTSTYYRPEEAEEPAWLEAFHAEHLPVERFGTPWEPLPEVAAAAEASEVLDLARIDFGAVDPWFRFPHALGGMSLSPGASYFAALYGTPFLDAYLARFARTLLEAEGLGRDAAPDLLALSFSAPDSVGHRYGPDSLEYLDTLVRLDRTLGELLDAVDRRVGLDRTFVVLTADHGVAPAPEVLAGRGEPGRRAGVEEALCFQRLEGELDRRFGAAEWLRPGPFFREEALARRGVERPTVEAASREYLEACPGVERVWTRAELATEPPAGASEGLLQHHSFHPERSSDLAFTLEEGFLAIPPPLAASHGSPYPYDTHVPWLLRGPGIEPGPIAASVATADVAPTLATLVGIPAPADLDGEDRSGALERVRDEGESL